MTNTIDDLGIEKTDVIKNHKVVSEEWVRKDELRKLLTESVKECEDFKFIANQWVKCSEEFGRCKGCERILELMSSVKGELEK